jgi:hypothetical protein
MYTGQFLENSQNFSSKNLAKNGVFDSIESKIMQKFDHNIGI